MNYCNIKHCDMVNLNGLRVSLFCSGCDHNCKGCFNPETHDPDAGKLFDDNAKLEIFKDLDESWCSGLTLLGGDPLYKSNRKDVLALIKEVKAKYPDKTIGMYTGYTLEECLNMNDNYVNEIFQYIDILCDGRFVENLKSPNKHWVGSSNQHIYKVIHKENFYEFERLDT